MFPSGELARTWRECECDGLRRSSALGAALAGYGSPGRRQASWAWSSRWPPLRRPPRRDAWAAGVSFNGHGNAQTLILHWNGTSWTRVPSPHPAGLLGSSLAAVSALVPGDVWAAGSVLERGNDQTLVLHRNGTRWTRS